MYTYFCIHSHLTPRSFFFVKIPSGSVQTSNASSLRCRCAIRQDNIFNCAMYTIPLRYRKYDVSVSLRSRVSDVVRFICSYAMYTSLRCHNRTNDIAMIARRLPNRKIVAQRNNQI